MKLFLVLVLATVAICHPINKTKGLGHVPAKSDGNSLNHPVVTDDHRLVADLRDFPSKNKNFRAARHFTRITPIEEPVLRKSSSQVKSNFAAEP